MPEHVYTVNVIGSSPVGPTTESACVGFCDAFGIAHKAHLLCIPLTHADRPAWTERVESFAHRLQC